MLYFIIEEYNEWENATHLMCFPYKDNFNNDIRLEILNAVMNAVKKIDEECGFNFTEFGTSKEEIEISQSIIGDSFDNYWSAIEIFDEIDISKLITCFVQIYYDIKADEDDDPVYVVENSDDYEKIYKGGIPHNFKRA